MLSSLPLELHLLPNQHLVLERLVRTHKISSNLLSSNLVPVFLVTLLVVAEDFLGRISSSSNTSRAKHSLVSRVLDVCLMYFKPFYNNQFYFF